MMRKKFRFWAGIIFCLILMQQHLTAQSMRPTRLIVIPKRTMLKKTFQVYDLNGKSSITLPYEQNDFYIYFDTGGFSGPYHFKFKDWNVDYESRTANSFVFFTNIPSGEYIFKVWSEANRSHTSAQITIRVESPLWLQWWFLPMLFFYALLLMAVIFYLLYRYRLRQVMRIHAIRENIARDLHDDMGSYLSSISVLSQSAQNLAGTDPGRAISLVQKIGETARQVMDSMGDIVWSVNPENDSIKRISTRMREIGAELLEEKDIDFNFGFEDTLVDSYLPLQYRRDFFLIYKEALGNIIKHSMATEVFVRLEKNGNAIELTIRDNGIGYTQEAMVRRRSLGGNGLGNITARAKKMEAMLLFESKPGMGTKVTLIIPLP